MAEQGTNNAVFLFNIGAPFVVEKVRLEDLEAGALTASWSLGKRHPGSTDTDAGRLESVLNAVLIGMLLSTAKGAWDVSDEWNRMLPDYKFVRIEEFLAEVWAGKL